MIDMRTIKVGDKVRHQASGAEGTVTDVHRSPGGDNDSIFIAAPTWLRGVPKGNLNAWDIITEQPLPWDPENPGQIALTGIEGLVLQARRALADENEGDYRRALDLISICAADMLDAIK